MVNQVTYQVNDTLLTNLFNFLEKNSAKLVKKKRICRNKDAPQFIKLQYYIPSVLHNWFVQLAFNIIL